MRRGARVFGVWQYAIRDLHVRPDDARMIAFGISGGKTLRESIAVAVCPSRACLGARETEEGVGSTVVCMRRHIDRRESHAPHGVFQTYIVGSQNLQKADERFRRARTRHRQTRS